MANFMCTPVNNTQAWELYALFHIYMPVKFTARPKIYPVCPKALSKKSVLKIRYCLCASFHFGKGRQALVVSVNPLASESTFISGHAQCGSWLAIMIFEPLVPVRCHVHEQINMAYQINIIQCDVSFYNENCRSWMDFEWNQLDIWRIFFRQRQGFRL